MGVQTVKTSPYQPEYSYEIGHKPYNAELMHFVHNEMCECVKKMWPGVKGLRYVEDCGEYLPNGQEVRYRQAVIIAFDNGYRKIANVEGDSNFAAMEDVMKRIAS